MIELVEFHSHAKSILSVDFPDAVRKLEVVLCVVTIPIEEIIGSGGGETKGTQRLRKALAATDCHKVNFVGCPPIMRMLVGGGGSEGSRFWPDGAFCSALLADSAHNLGAPP